MRKSIDLNCDLGEWRTKDGIRKDEAIMPFISSCNVACGGHIGDEASMRATIQLALEYGVTLGAHPGYPDRENFGRKVLDVDSDVLKETLLEQIHHFEKLLTEEGGTLHHIKPHGALYNYAAKDKKTANVVVSVVKSVNQKLIVYLPPNSVSRALAQKSGLHVVTEVFADRAYEDDLSLRSRSLPGSVLVDEADILVQLRRMVFQGEVNTFSGIKKKVKAETVCLHSDTPGSIAHAKSIHEFLKKHGVDITIP